MYLSNKVGSGGAIYINEIIEKTDISKSIFLHCYARTGGAIYTDKINNLYLNNICGSQCSNDGGSNYGYFAIFSATKDLYANLITACYNSGGSSNCRFISNYVELSESNYSNNFGVQEMSFLISRTANSVSKNIKICNNIGSRIGINFHYCTSTNSSYIVFTNLSLTFVDNSFGHITAHHTPQCNINNYYVDIPESNLSVLNAIDSKMAIFNSYINCPQDKLTDSNGNINFDSSNQLVDSVPQYILKVPELSECGKMLIKTLKTDIICQSCLNQFRMIMASVFILM